MSTFSGLEMSKRALFAQQGALHTTGHNISNVNTKGYSRQRVNFETTTPYPQPSRTMAGGAGQKGTGVQIGVIDRIRDKFLDMQYRSENSNLGYWETRQDALSRMEKLLNEPSDNGLQKTMDRFWQSLQDLADNPDNDGARSVVAQRGLAVAETFNHFSKTLNKIRDDLKEEIKQTEKNINGLLNDINEVNKQIKKIEPHGQLPNDLYDERDRLIDELSGYVNIKVDYTPSADSALDIADGIAEIKMVDENGDSIGVNLLTKKDSDDTNSEITDRVEIKGDDFITGITIDDKDIPYESMKKTGSLSALIQSYGYEKDKGDYPEVLKELNDMAAAFADEFNKVHGGDLNFFVNGANEDEENNGENITVGNITVNKEILEDGSNINVSIGDDALKLADVFDTPINIGTEGEDKKTSVRKFYNSLIGEIGVRGQEANRNRENTEILQNQVDNSRQSVSAVSLDEEITNLVQFQHAYNAAARNMTTVDEMIDRIINQMGLVGR